MKSQRNPRVNLTGQGYCGRLSAEANTAHNVMKCTCKPFEYPAGSICAHCIREEEYRLYGTPWKRSAARPYERAEVEFVTVDACAHGLHAVSLSPRIARVLRHPSCHAPHKEDPPPP